jgi:HPt (histidine-containing phosphotransfer) domain-containing protein
VSTIDNITGSGILDTEAALKRVDGNKDLYTKILESFIKKHAQDHELVIKNLEQGDTEAARNIIHSLKGVVQIVGSADLHSLSVKIDLLLMNRQFLALQKLLERFKEILSAVIISIQIHLDKTKETKSFPEATCKVSAGEVLQNIEYLDDLLKTNDMEATRESSKFIKKLPESISISHIAALQKNVDSLDFNNAASALQSIKQQLISSE